MTSKIASQFSAFVQATARGNRALILAAVLGVSSLVVTPVAQAQTKIGYVNVERILHSSNSAKSAQAKIESEFRKRNDELERLANSLRDRKSTRLNSSHVAISYAGFCLKKEKRTAHATRSNTART